MGLDAVELVMECEDRFGIELPDSETERCHTVADLVALVLTRLPRRRDGCPTARAFYEFRRRLIDEGVPRRRVLPAARLDELFPDRFRFAWARLRARDRRLPRLVATASADRFLLGLAVVQVVATVVGVILVWAFINAGAAALLLAASLAIAIIATARGTPFHRHLPAGIATVGDVARATANPHHKGDSPGERLIAQQRVFEQVRDIIHGTLAVPREKITLDAHFIRDLGLD
ncbi:MAG: hypothetical protein AMXMBFR58_23800 [Phycisphaerae bacterium]|nr:Acyl carrier protein [Phycisphaerales bacterium]